MTRAEKAARRAAVICQIQDFAAMYGRQPRAADWNPGMAENLGMPDAAEIRERYEREGWNSTTHVRTVFGTWNAAIRAPGFEPCPAGHRRSRAVA